MAEYAAPFAAFCALLRCSQVPVGLVKMMRSRRDRVRWHVSMRIAFPEPFLLAAAATGALLYPPAARPPAALSEALALLGAFLAASGIALFFWSLASYRGVGCGHYVDADHQLCTRGAYGLVRHPLYLAALLEWFGLAAAWASLPILALAAFYVLPAYLFYARSEEQLMRGVFGAAYEAYRGRVPMLIPWIRSA